MECDSLELEVMAPIAGIENQEGFIGYDHLTEEPMAGGGCEKIAKVC